MGGNVTTDSLVVNNWSTWWTLIDLKNIPYNELWETNFHVLFGFVTNLLNNHISITVWMKFYIKKENLSMV